MCYTRSERCRELIVLSRAREASPRVYNHERDPDGPGGTAHLVDIASKWGFKTVEVDARELLKSCKPGG